jgi:hypothetical protein
MECVIIPDKDWYERYMVKKKICDEDEDRKTKMNELWKLNCIKLDV